MEPILLKSNVGTLYESYTFLISKEFDIKLPLLAEQF